MTLPSALNVTETVAIESPTHLGEVLQGANQPVVPVGGGTCLATGNPTDHEFVALDMNAISGIDNYVPTDMTASFLAGTPIRDVVAALAANGQELPIDLAHDDAGTIGGLVATGFSGPRRYGQGTLKDLIIGCEYVRGDGLVAKAGGMTVKNVSGFEISRLLHGSWGSLAVLTRINLKILPIARADRTFAWTDTDAPTALDRQIRLLTQFPGCVALQTRSIDRGFQTRIRVVGRESAVDVYGQELEASVGAPNDVLNDASIWTPARTIEQDPVLVASNSVARSRELALHLVEHPAFSDVSVSLLTGTVTASIKTEILALADIKNIATGLWMIEGGGPAWKRGGSVWGPERPDSAVAKSVKMQFDPAGILNRGRLFI